MTYKAVLKLGQVVDPDDADERATGKPLLQDAVPDPSPNADATRRTRPSRAQQRTRSRPVDELVEWPDVDGLWLFARCTIDAPPGWLRRGTAASFECLPLRQQRMGDWNRSRADSFREASILPPGVPPAEPRAAVWLIQRAAEPSSTTQRRSVSTGPGLGAALTRRGVLHTARCRHPPTRRPRARSPMTCLVLATGVRCCADGRAADSERTRPARVAAAVARRLQQPRKTLQRTAANAPC